MNVTQKDIDKLLKYLERWQGGVVSFNSFHDDHDRLILKLECPKYDQESVGMSLFYCSYIAGPIRWNNSKLEVSLYEFEDGSVGVNINDPQVGFVARCKSVSLYGEPGVTIPQS